MKKILNVQKADLFDVIKALLFSLFFAIAFVVIFAIVVKYAELTEKPIAIVNIVLKVVSVLLGCLLGIRTQKNGAIKGFIVGLLFVLTTYLVFSLINGKFESGALTIFDVLAGAISGIISGIIAVNIRGRK